MRDAVTRPADRPHRAAYHERAVTYTWDLAAVTDPRADDGHAVRQAVLTIAWEAALHRYKVSAHRQVTWSEGGAAHRMRDTASTTTLGTKPAARFGPQALRRYAFSALMGLRDDIHPYFLPTEPLIQGELAAA